MSLLLQNLICFLLLALALLGLARGYGLLGPRSSKPTGCSKGCNGCQPRPTLGDALPPGMQLQRVKRFRLR